MPEILFEFSTGKCLKRKHIGKAKAAHQKQQKQIRYLHRRFFLLLPAGPCFLFNIYYYYAGLAQCDCFISFHFCVLSFIRKNWEFCFCGLIRMKRGKLGDDVFVLKF